MSNDGRKEERRGRICSSRKNAVITPDMDIYRRYARSGHLQRRRQMNYHNYTPDMHPTSISLKVNKTDFELVDLEEKSDMFSARTNFAWWHEVLESTPASEPRARACFARCLPAGGRVRESGPSLVSLLPCLPRRKRDASADYKIRKTFSSSVKQFPRRRQMIQTPL